MAERVRRTEEEWRELLRPDEYRVLRQGGPERPWSGCYVEATESGIYHCRACGAELFHSSAKVASDCGWPQFTEPIDPTAIELVEERGQGIARMGVRCSVCLSHLGHAPESRPYHMFSLSLAFRRIADGTVEEASRQDFEDGGDLTPVRIFLSSEDPRERVERAVADLLDHFELDVRVVYDGEVGSWFHELFIRARKSGTLTDQLVKVERALDLQTHLRTQAQVDASQGDVVAKLIVSLENTPNAIIQIGSVLLVKVSGDLLVRNLTQRELAVYERNPALFRDPLTARKLLESFQQEQTAASMKSADVADALE